MPSGKFYERSLSSLNPKDQEKLRYPFLVQIKLNLSENQTHTIENIIDD